MVGAREDAQVGKLPHAAESRVSDRSRRGGVSGCKRRTIVEAIASCKPSTGSTSAYTTAKTTATPRSARAARAVDASSTGGNAPAGRGACACAAGAAAPVLAAPIGEA